MRPSLSYWRSRKHSNLIRHYFLLSLSIVCAGLIVSGVSEIYFSHQENLEHVTQIQKEIASATAFKIERFLQEHVHLLRAATKSREIVSKGLTDEYRWELRRLLVNAPAISAVAAFDLRGQRRAEAARLRPIAQEEKIHKDRLADTVTASASYGPVKFGDGTGPSMTVTVPIERYAGELIGMLQAELDLKYIGQVMADVRVGKAGYAYLVSKKGELIAHPDLSLVLQKRNLDNSDQLNFALRTAPSDEPVQAFSAINLIGEKVFTSFAEVPGLAWLVFVEQPLGEIYAPIYASLTRTAIAFLAALTVALIAAVSIHFRVIRPLEALRNGVAQISQGDMSARLEVKTGDEFEALAGDFNSMATNLHAAYAELENKVVERTRELSAANQKLAEASQHKSRFLANANHELRTPLSSIISYARMLRRDASAALTPLQLENLDDLSANAERLLTLIDDLLDIASIEAGKIDVQDEAVDVEEIVHGVSLTVEPMITGQTVRLVQDIKPNLPNVRTDREKLRQVLLNLASNAVKFTDQGEIRLSAQLEGDHMQLAVADTGIGIEPEELDRIFDEFHRGPLRRNGTHRSTGLGLAIVKKTVALLGGEITVTSKPQKGSCFTVRLPLRTTTVHET